MKWKKKTKQSFTLVELSIVLLILSLLVGSLLVGRKIVDRAKLQRIMFEFDYYKKNFTLFQDTFEVLPGNVDVTTCKRYAEFSQVVTEAELRSGTEPTPGKYCISLSTGTGAEDTRVIEGYVSASVIASSDNWLPFVTGMPLAAGEACKDCISNAMVKATQGQASFDSEGAFSFVGVPENVTEMYYIRGSYMKEMTNELFRSRVSGKNILVSYRNTAASADDQGISNTATGVLSSTMANMMDVKMDDGQPGTGNMLALKGAYAYSSEGDKHKTKVCYNSDFGDVGSAFYLDNTDVKYGCNIVYLMSNN